jgi:hypothetical protein
MSASSTIIEDIETMRKSGLAALAIFYCDFREEKRKNLRGLLSSVLVQLCRQYDSFFGILSKFYLEHDNCSRAPSDDALVRCLKDLLQLPGQAPIFLIVDALDECPNTSALSPPRDKVLMLLQDLIDSQLPKLRIFVTSRPEADIKPGLEPLTFRSVSLHHESGQMEDIKHYIKSVVNTNRNMRRWKLEHKQLVIDVLTERADGMLGILPYFLTVPTHSSYFVGSGGRFVNSITSANASQDASNMLWMNYQRHSMRHTSAPYEKSTRQTGNLRGGSSTVLLWFLVRSESRSWQSSLHSISRQDQS